MDTSVQLLWPAPELNGRSWAVVNDGVMGGRSGANTSVQPDGLLVFSGTVSLANGGGFASTRRVLPATDLSDYAGIRIRVLGDWKRYSFRIRTDGEFDGVVYRQHFEPAPVAWRTVDLPFSQFEATFRGSVLKDARPLDPSKIHQIGFLIADQQQGPFRLRIESIAAYR